MEIKHQDIKDQKLNETFNLLKQIESVDKKKGYNRLVKPLRKRAERSRMWRRVAACAAIVLPLVIGQMWWREEPTADVLSIAKADSIVPGANTARLILGNKREILLDTMSAQNHIVGTGVSVRKEGTGVVYESSEQTKEADIVYNELIVPRGGEYDIILEDGTHVWLNADSKLKYPATFTGKERRVYLEGEGYFDVARDTTQPFFVETREQSIRVLGTAFNICAYEGERMNYATLVRGSVRVEDKQTETHRVLRPGEQLRLDVTNGEALLSEVDARKEIAWKEGMFVFHGQTLEQIMTKLSRWYNVTIFYQNEHAKNLLFKGNLPRYSDFQSVLEVLSKSSNVKFNVQNRVVIVSI